MPTLAETLKKHINKSDKSLRQISLHADVDYGCLYRFVNKDRNLQLNVVQRLCDHFELELRPKAKRKRKKSGKK